MKRAAAIMWLAVIALSALSTGSASAHTFLWTGPLPGLLLVLSTSPQVYEVEEGLQMSCKQFRGHGVLSNGTGSVMSIKTVKLNGTYSGCEGTGGFKITFSEVEYELNAEGSIGVIGKPIVISEATLGCSIKWNNGPPNDKLETVLYLNLPQDLLLHFALSHITSLASGGSCGTAGVEKTQGALRGLLLAWVDGGTLKWD